MSLNKNLVADLDAVLGKYTPDQGEVLTIVERYKKLIGERMGVNPAKLQANTTGELILCKAKGLTWNKDTVNGADGWNAQNQPIEIKVSFDSSTRANMTYKIKTRTKDESIEHWAQRNADHYLKMVSGGHHWGVIDKNNKLKWYWFVSAKSYCSQGASSTSSRYQRIQYGLYLVQELRKTSSN